MAPNSIACVQFSFENPRFGLRKIISYGHQVRITKERPITIQTIQRRLIELQESLQTQAWGLFVDIDGTIADIVPIPTNAELRPGCAHALDKLTESLSVVAVLTGRDLESAKRMVGLDNVVYFCNHGLERWENGEVVIPKEARWYQEQVRATAKRLEGQLNLPGIYVEEKGYGISVHYRNAPSQDQAMATIIDAITNVGAAQWMKLHYGKMLIDLRLPVEINKGTALQTLVEERNLQGAIVLGDDTTDIDMFETTRSLSEIVGLTYLNIAVLGSETPESLTSLATHTIQSVDDVAKLLLWLAAFQPNSC